MAVTDQAILERRAQIRALHAWLESQGIPRREWGPILASAVGVEIHRASNGEEPRRILGSLIITNIIDSYTKTGA